MVPAKPVELVHSLTQLIQEVLKCPLENRDLLVRQRKKTFLDSLVQVNDLVPVKLGFTGHKQTRSNKYQEGYEPSIISRGLMILYGGPLPWCDVVLCVLLGMEVLSRLWLWGNLFS